MVEVMTRPEQLQAEIAALTAEIEARKAELRSFAQASFHRTFAKLFELYPQVESVRWTQYTPYFNDGSPCEFGVNIDEDYGLWINGVEKGETFDIPYSEYVVELPEGHWLRRQGHTTHTKRVYDWDNPTITDPVLYPLFAPVSAFLKRFDDEVYRDIFGDHVEVTATREGFRVVAYEHD